MKQQILLCLLIIASIVKAQVTNDIDQYLSDIYKDHVMPGFSVVVLDKDRLRYSGSFGFTQTGGHEKFTPQTISPIGSLTKSITALAVLQLVEDGLIALDDPVKKYLPEFTTANAAESDLITVRMLLNNTAGLRPYTGCSFDISEKSMVDILDHLSNSLILTTPGTAYRYSNVGFSIAGLLVSWVTGKSYADYVAEHIFEPLGMRNTSVLPKTKKQQARGHYPGINRAIVNNEPVLESGEFIPAGAFTQSTAEDLAKYLMMYLNQGTYRGRHLLAPELLASKWKPEISFVGLSEKEGGDGRPFHYGLGWMIAEIDGRKVVHHGGSTGTASSFTMIDPDRGLAVSLLSNVDLTLVDRHRFPFGLNIVNNILHLAAGEPITNFAIPPDSDPTANTFELRKEQQANYAGYYEFKQGGDNFVYYDQPWLVITSAGEKLQGRIVRNTQIINEFIIDFITPAQAVSRNIASPSRLYFQLDMSGEVAGAYAFGMKLKKINTTEQKLRQAYQLKSLQLSLPGNWKIEEINKNEFVIFHPERKDIQVIAKVSISDADRMDSSGAQYKVRYKQILWEKQMPTPDQISPREIRTRFTALLGAEQYDLILTSTPEAHSYLAQKIMKPILEHTRLKE